MHLRLGVSPVAARAQAGTKWRPILRARFRTATELMIGKGLTEDPANLDKFDKFHSEIFTWIGALRTNYKGSDDILNQNLEWIGPGPR